LAPISALCAIFAVAELLVIFQVYVVFPCLWLSVPVQSIAWIDWFLKRLIIYQVGR